jgi:hypothetical protein
MIKATDLRVGNLLNYHTAEGDILPSKMDWQDFKWIDEDEKGFNLVHSPIPITEELLIKAGFRLYETGYFCLDILGEKFYFTIGAKYDKTPKIIMDNGKDALSYTLKHIQHLHQLQNLYHALTGEELIFEGLN